MAQPCEPCRKGIAPSTPRNARHAPNGAHSLQAFRETADGAGPLSLWERARVRAVRSSGIAARLRCPMPSPPAPLPAGEGSFADWYDHDGIPCRRGTSFHTGDITEQWTSRAKLSMPSKPARATLRSWL